MVAVMSVFGGWTLLLAPVLTSVLLATLDQFVGQDRSGLDPETAEAKLFWYRAITLIWAPLQLCLVFGTLAYVTRTDHLAIWEELLLFISVGFVTGAIGIVYAHELMHQKNRIERWRGDILMCVVLYGHFRSEHLLVHHRYVGTPRDPVTARYNEHFYAFFRRVLPECLRSAFNTERSMLARKGLPWWHRSNPFWRYAVLQLGFLALAAIIGGLWGLVLFLLQAFFAVLYLEMINYMEHYGLTREHLGDGKYEHVKPHHSWNAEHKVSNWFLINLQRHSDHHYKPNRRFPLLQTYDEETAPQLPHSYPLMAVMAFVPPVWLRVMNARVRKWRKLHYPHITDWEPYKKASHPLPR